MKLSVMKLSQAVKQTIETYVEVRTKPELIDFYKDSPEAITIENVAENELECNMKNVEYEQEDLEEVIRISKVFLDIPDENLKQCPKCKMKYKRLLALSRRDNKTMICDQCGTKEAIEDLISL